MYRETNWLPLSERRLLTKLKFLAKIEDNRCPEYLRSLLPEKVGATRPMSRYAEDFKIPKCRTETFKQSFIPSTIKAWNELPNESRNEAYFKEQLKFKPTQLYNVGNRINNVKHAQLRMNCSKLNAHLFQLHVTDTMQCPCGYDVEDSEHFLLHCPLYHIQRLEMIQTIVNVEIEADDISQDFLLYGSEFYSTEKNVTVIEAVHKFISDTERL